MRIKEYSKVKRNSALISILLAMSFICSIQASKAQPLTPAPEDTIIISQTTFPSTLIRDKVDLESLPTGEIWFATRAKGLFYYDGTSWFGFDKINSALLSDSLFQLHLDVNSNLWIVSTSGLTLKTSTFFTYPFNTTSFPKSKINGITSNSTSIFVGGSKGISVLDLNSQTWTLYNKLNSPLASDTINCLFADNFGKIWIGTNNGYAIYDNGTITSFNYTNSLFPKNSVKDIVVTPKNILFSTNNLGILKMENNNYISMDSIYFGYASEDFCNTSIYYGLKWKYPISYNFSFDVGPNNEIFFRRYTDFNPKDIELYYLDTLNNLSGRIFENANNWTPLFLSFVNYYRNDSIIFVCANGYSWWNVYKINYLTTFNEVTPSLSLSQLSNFIPAKIPSSYVGGPQTDLIGNRVSARILNVGDLHWDPVGQTPHYEVPIGSNLVTTYTSAIWLGGYDSSNTLYVAAQSYRQDGTDFWPGPLDSNGEADSTVSTEFDHIWMANRTEIDAFRYQFALGNIQNGNYPISNFIATWPAYYTAAPNYPQRLAPYVDFNGDNLYNPMDGDYPEIKGDQMAWWIFNDELHYKTETNAPTMKLEIHASAYSINCNSDSNDNRGLNYTTFYHYTLHNRGNKDFDSCYFAMWTDPDLGNAADDYVGCNIGLNTFYSYNGDSIDEGTNGYGACPPRQNITFLNAPLAELNDGKDNNHDGQTDENGEKLGMSSFVYYIGWGGAVNGNPTNTDDYYQFLTGSWKDGLPITYGGDGRNPGNGNTGIPSPFMFPDSTNPNFSTSWTMENGGIQPTDMRGVGSVGPFNLPAGDSATFDLAFITGPNDKTASENVVRSVIDKFSSGSLFNYHNISTPIKGPTNVTGLNTEQYITSLDTSIYTILWSVQNGSIIYGQGTNMINVTWSTNDTGYVNIEVFENGNACKAKESLRVLIGPMNVVGDSSEIIVRMYPNPTIGILNIETKNNTIEQYCIYNLQGQLVKCASYSNLINTDELQSGAYILELRNKSNESLVRKLFIRN